MAISNVVTDTFSRTLGSSWGTADTGQAYSFTGFGGTVNEANDCFLSGGHGNHKVPASSAWRMHYLASLSLADVDARVSGSVQTVPTGGALEIANVVLRGTGTSTGYLFRVQIETNASVTALIFAPTTGTLLASTTVPGLTYAANMQLTVRAQAVGTTVRMRVWQATATEPLRWLLSAVDSTYTGAGWVGVRSGVGSGNTTTKPVVFTYDNVSVGQPDVSTFPDADLALLLYAAFGADLNADPYTWVYTDLSSYLLDSPSVTVRHGRSDGAGQATPASLAAALDNVGGQFTKGHPASPWYPFVRKNTPILCLTDPDSSEQPVLFDGFAAGWSPGWNAWSKQPGSTLTAAGTLQRLKQGTTPIRSALYRAVTAANPVGYWPMEDSANSTQMANAIPGGVPLIFSGNFTLASDTSEPGSAPLPVVTATTFFQADTPAPITFSGNWQVDWYFKLAALPAADSPILTMYGDGGTAWYWQFIIGPTTMYVTAHDFTGTQIGTPTAFGLPAYLSGLQWVHARLMAQQSGGNISWEMVLFPLIGIGNAWGGTIAGTVGNMRRVARFPDANLTGMAVGHLAVFDGFNIGAADKAQSGFTGETADVRIRRLCTEQRVPIAITGTSNTMMGPQGVGTFISLLQDCEDADGGQMYDGLSPGLGYITRSSRYNRPSKLTIDYSTIQVTDGTADNQVLVPVDDDQLLRNEWEVSRSGGSAASADDLDGELGVNAVDLYDSSTTVNVATDTQLPDQASWRVHLGTTPGLRYPQVLLDLDANPTLLHAWMALGLLDVATLTGLPPEHPPGDVDVAVLGWSQVIGRRKWQVTANVGLAEPYRVGVYDDPGTRYESDGTTLHTAVNTTATSFVADVVGPLWVTGAVTFDMVWDGEQVTVTHISGASSPQTFTVTRSVNSIVKSHAAGAAGYLAKQAHYAL